LRPVYIVICKAFTESLPVTVYTYCKLPADNFFFSLVTLFLRSGELPRLHYQCSALPPELSDLQSEQESNLRFPGVVALSTELSRLQGEGFKPSTHNVLAGITCSNNSIQIVTTSALPCFFKTPTWFAFCRCIPVLPLGKLFC
jgi:hypothetical protein